MRRRYRWDTELQQMVEIGADWTDAPMRAETTTEELVHGGARATDGTDISTRRRRREYMKANGLADADDYKETWAKAAEKRAEWYTHGGDAKMRAERREDVGRAMYQLEMKRRR